MALMAKMVSPSKEGKLREKRGKDAFEQAASMMMAVSIIPPFDIFFFKVLLAHSSLFFYSM